jgi:hypothetical protein
MTNQKTETQDTPAQVAAKENLSLLNNLSLPDALQACDIAKVWLPAKSYVQSRIPPN